MFAGLYYCIYQLKGKKIASTQIRTLTFRENSFICFNESPLKIMKDVFYFTLKALFVLKIFKFGHLEKTA